MGAGRRQSVRAALAACGLLLAGCYWTQPGFNSHRTGFNAHEHAITSANAAELEVEWSTPLPGSAMEVVRSRQGLVHVLVDGGPALNDAIVTVEPDTGAIVWSVPLDLEHTELTQVITSGTTLLVPRYDPAVEPHGCLAAFDVATGDDLGCTAFESPPPSAIGTVQDIVYSPAVSGNWVVLTQSFSTAGGGWAGWLSVTHLTDPSRSWTRVLSDAHYSDASNPIIMGSDVLVVGGSDERLLPLLQRWPLSCGDPACEPVTSVPVPVVLTATGLSASIDGSLLAVHGMDDVVVLDATSGETLWRGFFGDENVPHPRAVPTWTPDGLLVSAQLSGDFDAPTRLLRFPHGCGADECTPEWTADVPGWSDGQSAAAADVVVVGTVLQAAAVFPVDCTDPCEPIFELDGFSAFGPPILTDGRIIADAYVGGSSRLIALAPPD